MNNCPLKIKINSKKLEKISNFPNKLVVIICDTVFSC